MSYFPFFVDLSGRRGLIVGGGAVALRKIQKLLPYGPVLTAAAPAFCPGLRDTAGVTLLERPFSPEDLDRCDFVIAATDDRALNHQIAELCGARRLPVNVADCKEDCSFLFPALIQRGALSVGISTGGAGPTAAVYLKERFTELLPEGFEEILAFLETARETVKGALPGEEARRKRLLAQLFYDCMEVGRPLSQAELTKKIQAVKEDIH